MNITGPGTIDDLVADARASGHKVTSRLIADWVSLGLLDRPVRKAKGRGKGSAKGQFPENQRLLFLTLLDKRAEGARHVRTLAQVPVFLWCMFGDAYVPTRQVLRAFTTWLGDTSANLDRAQEIAKQILTQHDHPSALPADRKALEDILTQMAHSGRLRDRDGLLRAVRRVFEPEEIYGQLHRAIGHPEALLTAETFVVLTEVRLAAIHGLQAGHVTESDMRQVRQVFRMSRMDYLAHLAEYRAQAPKTQSSFFAPETSQTQFDNCAHDLLTCLGQMILNPQFKTQNGTVPASK